VTANTRAPQIVAAAYRCLAERGFEGLRMRDVAAAAGINIATVHYYFPSKEDLIAGVVAHAHEVFSSRTAPPPAGEPAERLRYHLRAAFDVLIADPRLGAALAEIAARSRRDAAVAATVGRAERVWQQALVEMLSPLPDAQAQAVGAMLDGKAISTFGDAACISLYPTKNIHSIEGGIVVTPDAEVARQVRLLRNQGMEERYKNEVIGLNNRLSSVHAAVGRVQLTKLAGWTKQRQENAKFLDANLKGVGVPPVAAGAEHVYHQYTIRVTDEVEGGRDGLAARLKERGIGTGMYYPIPIHRLPSFQRPDVVSRVAGELVETEKAALEALSLPVMPTLTQDELERIVAGVNAL